MIQKFIQVAVNAQTEASSPIEAEKNFKTSCNICSNRGIKLDCERCPVKFNHELVMAVFADLQEYDKNKMA